MISINQKNLKLDTPKIKIRMKENIKINIMKDMIKRTNNRTMVKLMLIILDLKIKISEEMAKMINNMKIEDFKISKIKGIMI